MNILLYILLAVVGFYLLMMGHIWFSGYRKKGRAWPDPEGELGQKIKGGQRWLFYFYTPLCSACRHMTPVIDTMLGEKKNVVKIDVRNDLQLARQLGVLATPATLIVENGRIQRFILGARSETFLRKLI